MTTDPNPDRLDDLRTEYANTGMVTSDGAVWLISQVVVLRERLDRLSAAPAAVPPTDRAGLRKLIAEALMAWAERNNSPQYARTRRSETVTANAYSRADAVLSVLPDTARLHDEILTLRADQAKMRDLLRTENQRADAAIDRETAAEEAEEEHRLALSTALGLGTSAPWDAIRERAAELAGQGVAGDRGAVLEEAADELDAHAAQLTDTSDDPAAFVAKARARAAIEWRVAAELLRRLAAETPGPETQGEAQQDEARTTWMVESTRRGEWKDWSPAYEERDWGLDRYKSAISHVPGRPFRLVRATTTYAVEAEHTPATETPDTPRREPHPTEADMRHALAVAAKFHGQAATAPAVVAEPGKEA